MAIANTSRLFKFTLVVFVAALFLILVTKQRISEVTQFEEANMGEVDKKSFFDQMRDKYLFNKEEEEVEDNLEEDEETQMPFDDRMPGAYLKFLEPAPADQSYCKYNYDFPYDLNTTKEQIVFPPQLKNTSLYRVLYNIVEAHDYQNAAQVTYATHVTVNFAYFIPQMLKQWDGLITVAAYVPDLDSALFMEQINQYCYCEPGMHRVSIHLITHRKLMFSKKDFYFDRPENCVPHDSSKVATIKDYDETLVYPINVVRNVARTSALTKYVLLSDIELMPSRGLAGNFLQMVEELNKTANTREVFVLPIFEVEDTESIPENKEELLKLMDAEKAVYFHQLVCKHCQKFPGLDEWKLSGYSEKIKPLKTVKRHTPYNRWEPIFIGTNAEPLYTEKLTWEGLQDKMTQSLEMCLLDYDYSILDNAFLCHWPGIKKKKVADEDWRAHFVESNQAVYKEVIKDLLKKYMDIPGCEVNYTAKSLPTKKPSTVDEFEIRHF